MLRSLPRKRMPSLICASFPTIGIGHKPAVPALHLLYQNSPEWAFRRLPEAHGKELSSFSRLPTRLTGGSTF